MTRGSVPRCICLELTSFRSIFGIPEEHVIEEFSPHRVLYEIPPTTDLVQLPVAA